jgi:hypothetical protein
MGWQFLSGRRRASLGFQNNTETLMVSNMQRFTRLLGVASAVGAALVGCGGGDGPAAPTVQTLSSKPEYVSGGDALVDISLGDPASPLMATLNGVDVSSAFAKDANQPGHMVGLVTGIKDGENTLVASNGGATTTYKLTGYPISGTIFSGPHIQPFVCQTDAFPLPDGTTLGPSTDANCSATTKVQYVYKANDGTFKLMPSLTSLPADLANATIIGGATVPYVVRLETGTIDRGIYQIAIIHDPTSEGAPSPLAPPKGWSKRLLWVHGYGCVGGWYVQGTNTGSFGVLEDLGLVPPGFAPPGLAGKFNVLDDAHLSKGYAVATNTMSHPSVSCNPILAGEATAMTKEHFIEQFGVPLFTVSKGGSGGAYSSLQIADAFPGLFDGVSVSAVFPDALSIGLTGLDEHLLMHYFTVTNPAGFTDANQVAVSGYQSVKAMVDAANQSGRTDPIPNRVDITGYQSGVWTSLGNLGGSLPVALRYDPVTNPTGARPTIFDVSGAIYGKDKTTGHALRPYDNVGVQYGLNALNRGAITTTQFLDLNEKVGGVDSDGNYVAGRTVGDADAIKRTYQSGLSLGGNGGLASIPVLDTGSYNDASGYHYQWFHFAVRERLRMANGNADNMVMWRGAAVSTADANAMFENWMTAYKTDTSADSARAKAIRAKPATGVDGCYDKSSPARFVAEPQTFSSQPDTTCNTLWPSYSFSRKEAGGPLAGNILKCQLKPVVASDYSVTFTPAELDRLNSIFPTGVCDWTKPGVGQTGVVPYASFGPSPVNLIFDVTKP